MISWIFLVISCADLPPETPEIGQWHSPDEGLAVSANNAVGDAPLSVTYRLVTTSGTPAAGPMSR